MNDDNKGADDANDAELDAAAVAEAAEWDEAFDDVLGADDDKSDDDKKDDDDDDKKGTDDDGSDDKSGDEGADSKGDDKKAEDDKARKSDDDKDGDDSKKDDDKAVDPKQVVKDALRELSDETATSQKELDATASEAFKLVFPNGVRDPRVDSDGDKLKSAKEVEALINPATKELFTPEEAKEWFESATKKYEGDLATANKEATRVAELTINMNKGREAVMRNYGDFIKENPEIAKKVADAYMRTVTLAGEGDNAYFYHAPIDILEFYNDVMYPQVELAEKRAEEAAAVKAAEEKKAADIKAGKAAREENRDLKVTAPEDAGKSSEEGEWDNAFKDYYGGR